MQCPVPSLEDRILRKPETAASHAARPRRRSAYAHTRETVKYARARARLRPRSTPYLLCTLRVQPMTFATSPLDSGNVALGQWPRPAQDCLICRSDTEGSPSSRLTSRYLPRTRVNQSCIEHHTSSLASPHSPRGRRSRCFLHLRLDLSPRALNKHRTPLLREPANGVSVLLRLLLEALDEFHS